MSGQNMHLHNEQMMPTMVAETEWIESIAPHFAIRFLARLSWEITIAGRNSYEVGTDQIAKPTHLRRVNEVQHRVTACLSQLLEDKCPNGFIQSVAQMVLAEEDDELRGILKWSWVQAKQYVQAK